MYRAAAPAPLAPWPAAPPPPPPPPLPPLPPLPPRMSHWRRRGDVLDPSGLWRAVDRETKIDAPPSSSPEDCSE